MKIDTSNLHFERHPQYEFCFPRLDTLVLVEQTDDQVVIRATRDTFSDRRKIFFIRELAVEGFISEDYQWFSGYSDWPVSSVSWLVDHSWLGANSNLTRRTNRVMARLIIGASLLLLAMISGLMC